MVISHAPCIFGCIAVTSNLWIIPSNPQTLGSAIMIICPDKATSTVPLQQPFQILRLSPACSAMSRYFHLALHYEDHTIKMNVSLDTANINEINISTLDFTPWQHFSSNWNPPHLQKLADVPEVSVAQLYRNMINTSELTHLFTIKDDDIDPSLIWTILMHPETYIGTICMIFAVCIVVCCFKIFWIRPATPRSWPYSPVSLQHAIADDDIEVAPIYRHGSMVDEPRRHHKNHDLCIEWKATRPESHCKQPALAKEFL